MMQKWYLMSSDNDMVSGFESGDFDLLAKDAFDEALNTSIGCEVEICNFDLSLREKKRVIMEGNVQDSKLNTLNRRMLTAIGTCHAGQYVYYKNRYWLIIGIVDDNGLYEKAVLIVCNYHLAWKTSSGAIAQRWCAVQSASQYNNGEYNDRYVYIRNDQLMLFLPSDNESLLLPHGKRFVIDARSKLYEKYFSDEIKMDTSNPLITYEITRVDNTLFDYQESGYIQLLVTQDEQHTKDGYYVINGTGYWLCEDPEFATEDKSHVLLCSIECTEPIIYNGLDPTVFTARFFNANGDPVEIAPKWEIICEFVDRLIIKYIDNMIYISSNNKELINKSFELSLSAKGYEKASIVAKVKAFM